MSMPNNNDLNLGDKVLMVCKFAVGIEEIVRITPYQYRTNTVDVSIPDGFDREYVLGKGVYTTALHKDRMVRLAAPAVINLSGHGEHTVVGVYYRP